MQYWSSLQMIVSWIYQEALTLGEEEPSEKNRSKKDAIAVSRVFPTLIMDKIVTLSLVIWGSRSGR